MYKAHINENTQEIQTVKQHSEETADLCKGFAIPELQDVLYAMGLLHDIGKYQKDFQLRIDGKNIPVEHSTCGAIVAKEKYKNAVAMMMEYCIAGHHSGLPNSGSFNDTPDKSTLYGRMGRDFRDYSAYKDELEIPKIDEKAFSDYLSKDCATREEIIDKFAFFTRYCFSCLTDADSLDTAKFCNGEVDRALKADFEKCLAKVNKRLSSFTCETDLQKARAVLQQQVFDKVNKFAEIYLMNMPTGSGKTLCSMKFALERAVTKGKKRIIYIIPYNSIIDQTAETFEKLFGENAEILRHQSTFSYDDCEDYSEDYRQTAKYATENWDAQLIITTAVQFFESVYGNKRGKLRKLHNMADSILIFDEAHLMPQKYLKPCLQAISYITKYLNSEAVFLTATMPDFKALIGKYALASSRIENLIEDTAMFKKFNKCEYQYIGSLSDEGLLLKARDYPSSLIIVNERKTARKLYAACGGTKYHLSTYMAAFDRKRVIDDIKSALFRLEQDYPELKNVPDDRKITVISTSLIEAGVDLDFYTVFREMSGLDSILQSGGRCNREGKRKTADVFIFSLDSSQGNISKDERANITKGLMSEYENIACSESIKTYYDRLFFTQKEDIAAKSISQDCKDIRFIHFKDYAEQFELIDSKTVSVVTIRDENSRKLIDTLKVTGIGDSRKLQKYAFSVYQYEFDSLQKQHVVDDFGSGIWCLTNKDYYDENTGVKFEAKDYIVE